MLKRMSGGSRQEENYEHVLMCLICRSLFDDYDHQPKFLPCHHTFCKDCLREYVKQIGDEIECPSCRKIANIPAAGVAALQTNFYVKYIHGLVTGGVYGDCNMTECPQHPSQKVQYFCQPCSMSVCVDCTSEGGQCNQHKKLPLTTVTEEYHQKLDTSFAKSNALIERKKVELEGMLKALCEEKDQALLKIDSTFEQHAHTLHRRATLLKNKVIDIYNEHVGSLEQDLEEISTAMTCVVSLKEYHESKISTGEFRDVPKGIEDMEEVYSNITGRINPKENHIIFEDRHGMEKYKASAKDLGRVRCNRPAVPRAEPEGNDNAEVSVSGQSSLPNTPNSLSDIDGSPQKPAPTWGFDNPVARVPSPTQNPADPAESAKVSDAHIHQGISINGVDISSSPKRLQAEPCRVQENGDGGVEGNEQGNEEIHRPCINGAPVDANANNMAVRPKTLQRSPRKATGSAVIAKPIKGRKSPGTEHKELTLPQNEEPCGAGAEVTSEPESPLQGATCNRPLEHAISLHNPVLDSLKETDKMYHHLVYTSYDEEELLKELMAGKAKVDVPPVPRRAQDVSDSWTTISSDGSVISEQQSSL